jgi:AhpD family alkylhydroperoxidase
LQIPETPKRTLTPGNVVETTARFAASLPVLVPALVRPKTSAALREKVMLGVTSVNDSRYCKWLHTHVAMAEGVPREEVDRIFGPVNGPPDETDAETADDAAIRFGRRYAERLDQVDPEALERLRRHYGDAQVDEVLAYVRFITFANLLGNTADAFLGKLFLNAAGVAASPLALFMLFAAGLDRRVGMDAYSPTPRRRPDPTPSRAPRTARRR